MTVSIPRTLLEQIDTFARHEKRSRSNWIVKELEALFRAKKAADIHALPMAAEQEGEYKTKRAIKPHDTTR